MALPLPPKIGIVDRSLPICSVDAPSDTIPAPPPSGELAGGKPAATNDRDCKALQAKLHEYVDALAKTTKERDCLKAALELLGSATKRDTARIADLEKQLAGEPTTRTTPSDLMAHNAGLGREIETLSAEAVLKDREIDRLKAKLRGRR